MAKKRLNTKSVQLKSDLKRHYGTTVEFYNSLNKKQKGLCKICGKTNGKRRLCVDHDHATGKVRGLLYSRCNLTLSAF